MSLYDDRTRENLQEEALEDLRKKAAELPESDKVDASEGSFIYMALAKQAVRLEEAYSDLDEMNDNMLVDTQDIDHLIDSGVECGVPINEGTAAIVVVDLNRQCEIGDEFTAIDSDYNYIATKLVSIIDNEDGSKTYRYYMEADEDGVDPGRYRGEVEPVDFLDGFENGAVVNVHESGTDQEEKEEYRERRLNSFNLKACAGNRDYYITTIGELQGVGGVKVERRQLNQSYIPCYIQAADYGVPTAELLAYVKETMDPVGNEGEGNGLCPLGHVLQVNPVDGVTIDVAARFTFDEGYSFASLSTAIREAVEGYIAEQGATWQDSSSIIIRRSMVEAKILTVTGVLDVQDPTLNGDEENITTTAYEVPVLGTITEVDDG